ncbi:MAG: HAD family hydrolase [Oscillospiraceae bacterium]
MVKLVAADMDGTLLDSSHNMPADTADIIRKMNALGVRFAAASGRQYQSVKKLFDDIGSSDDMFFIAENGGIVCERGSMLHCETIPEEDVHMLIDMLAEMPDVHIILSGVESAYVSLAPSESDFGKNAALYCEKLTFSEDLHSPARADRITKIAVFDPDAEHGCYPVLKRLDGKFNVVLSGTKWVDIVSKAADKGSALRFIAEHMGISSAEVMAFGDYLNDLSMIEYAGESCAMDNAHPLLKQAAKHIVPSNDDRGVTETIKKMLFEQ